MEEKLITLAIHTYQKANIIKTLLESEGIEVCLHNVNLISPMVSSGVRVRIKESDLPAALKFIENTDFFREEGIVDTESKRVKRILIPIDFSEYSMQACEIGFHYANDIQAEVSIIHTHFIPVFPAALHRNDNLSYPALYSDEDNPPLQKTEEDLRRFKSAIERKIAAGELPKVAFTVELLNGLPEEEIVAYSNRCNTCLLIMGTRGKSQKDIDLIGSVTAEVIDMSRFPVFAIPEKTPFRHFSEVRQIAFGANFDQNDLVSFDTLFKMFQAYPDITYNLFHIAQKKDAWDEIKLAGIKEYFAKQYPNIRIKYDVLDAQDLVLNVERFIRDNRIDIISITTYKRNLLSRMFNPSITRKMLFHTDTPLLALRS